MEESDDEREREAAAFAERFKYRFKYKFGVMPTIKFNFNQPKLIPLTILAEASNTILNTLSTQFYSDGIATSYHDDYVLMCRWCYYKIALDMGHKRHLVSAYIKQSPQSVGYALGKIKQLIKHDGREKDTFERIKKEVNEAILRTIDDV